MTAMELDDILKFERLICTGDTARSGWVIDQDAVIEAMDLLNIQLPVRIRFTTVKRFVFTGTHRETPKQHVITLAQNVNAEHQSATLWHELAHAMQAERYARETGLPITRFYAEYKRGRGEWGMTYLGNKYEIEADRIMNEHRDDLLVVRR